MSRVFTVLAVVIFMITVAVPAVVFAEEINHQQIVKMNEAEWEDFQYHLVSGEEMDNVVAFYNEAPDTISISTNSTIVPMNLNIYSDLVRATVDWSVYLVGDLADYDLSAYLADGNGTPLTLWANFQHLTANLARITFFNLPNAYIIGNSMPDVLQLELWLSSFTITQPCEGQFYMLPNTVRMRPRPGMVTPDTLWGSYVEVMPEEGYYVEINQLPLPGGSHYAGDVNVQVASWSFYSNVPCEVQKHFIEFRGTNGYEAWLSNGIQNIRLQCPGFTATPIDIEDFTWDVAGGFAEFELTDAVYPLAYNFTYFEILADLDEGLSTGSYTFTLGSTSANYCFGPTSIKNLSNNQFIWNITPATPITWGPIYVTGSVDDHGVNGEDGGEVIIPTEFKTSNFPNPFNAVTKIHYALPEAANVILTVYDITGREVVRLADGYYSVGEHFVVFDGTGLSSGIYFYSITAGEYSAVKKMMLVK